MTDLSSVNVDSEMRFYGIMFLFYGGCIIWMLRDYSARYRFVPFLMAVFFLAGIDRMIGFFWKAHRINCFRYCYTLN